MFYLNTRKIKRRETERETHFYRQKTSQRDCRHRNTKKKIYYHSHSLADWTCSSSLLSIKKKRHEQNKILNKNKSSLEQQHPQKKKKTRKDLDLFDCDSSLSFILFNFPFFWGLEKFIIQSRFILKTNKNGSQFSKFLKMKFNWKKNVMEFLSFDSSSTIVQITEIENRRETPTHSTCFFFLFFFVFPSPFRVLRPRLIVTICSHFYKLWEKKKPLLFVCVCVGRGHLTENSLKKWNSFFFFEKIHKL